MISLGNYYHFAASEIECVEVSTVKAEYPYRITVYLKSGASRSVNYKNEQNRNSARDNLIRQIEHERKADYERLYNAVSLLSYNVKTINGRQLRIWRQLRDLLGVKITEE
jgi:hypothetical protein